MSCIWVIPTSGYYRATSTSWWKAVAQGAPVELDLHPAVAVSLEHQREPVGAAPEHGDTIGPKP
jgi:hypothetical protein